ncbi:S8 family peptidase [Desulfurispirillum indicum]|uniref:S8 family peptidase n=1 Tax=Desulfurispirillum indicum TaxID=936456 RepID=UPI001CFAAF7A|nr:S8 family peptidase [Desulfurispirillum indicum]UCZ55648.1 S8 family peptidase [Desulfurispirillum indicum]
MKFPIRLSCLIGIFCQWAAAQVPIEHIIIKPTPGALATPLSAIHQDESLKAAAPSLGFDSALAGGAYRLRLPYAMSPAEAEAYVLSLHSHLDLEYAEPDWRVYPAVEPDDPDYNYQWHYHDGSLDSPYGIQLPAAWEITTGDPDMIIAVLDTGLVPHGDIATAFDGSGRVLPGYDFYSDDSDPTDPGDYHNGEHSSWHGTHVTGTIGALTDNGLGVAGINWQSKILPVRVLRHDGSISGVINGIYWAAGHSVPGVPDNPSPARILNLSIQGTGTCPNSMQNAVNVLRQQGVIIVAAAGNDNMDAGNTYPANCSGVIAVGATDYHGRRAAFSNFGDTLLLSAPGLHVVSTLNTGTTAPVATPEGDTYGYLSGTSMAAPHVAGVISLMLAANPLLSQEDIELILIGSATLFPEDSDCHSKGCGAGILNAHRALEFASTYDEHLRSLLQNYARLVNNTDYTNLLVQYEHLQAQYEQLQQQILEREQLQQSQQERIEKQLLGSSGSSSSGGCGAGSSSDATLPAAFSLAGIYLLRPRRNL